MTQYNNIDCNTSKISFYDKIDGDGDGDDDGTAINVRHL